MYSLWLWAIVALFWPPPPRQCDGRQENLNEKEETWDGLITARRSFHRPASTGSNKYNRRDYASSHTLTHRPFGDTVKKKPDAVCRHVFLTDLKAIEWSKSLLLNQLQLVATQVELLEAGAKIHESFPVNALDAVLRQPQHLVQIRSSKRPGRSQNCVVFWGWDGLSAWWFIAHILPVWWLVHCPNIYILPVWCSKLLLWQRCQLVRSQTPGNMSQQVQCNWNSRNFAGLSEDLRLWWMWNLEFKEFCRVFYWIYDFDECGKITLRERSGGKT